MSSEQPLTTVSESAPEHNAVKALEMAFFTKLNNTVKAAGKGGLYLTIRHGVEEKEEEDENEEEIDEKTSSELKPPADECYSEEQLGRFRFIIMNERREKLRLKAASMATMGQLHDGFCCMTFDTTTGNATIRGILKFTEAAMKVKNLAGRFDVLLGLTLSVEEYDTWIDDNEYGGAGCKLLLISSIA